jgi:hypothetical protein
MKFELYQGAAVHLPAARFTFAGARFGDGQNRGADFRIVTETLEFGVGQLTLTR